jgi:cytochrome c peroxidase
MVANHWSDSARRMSLLLRERFPQREKIKGTQMSMFAWKRNRSFIGLLASVGGIVFLPAIPVAGEVPGSLKTVEVPLPQDLGDFVTNSDVATALGKALLWDTQVGGDGQTACATCHFSAGVDARTVNTVNPGFDKDFNGLTGPLKKEDFPFAGKPHADNIVGSQGVAPRIFQNIVFGSAVDNCLGDIGGTRQVTGRNAPGLPMAIFNIHNFWDGRAKREFNGVNPFGEGQGVKIWVKDPRDGLVRRSIIIQPASAASQEVGPPNNGVEMSCAGRTFAQLGRKMINNGLTPLGQQMVAHDDSVLGQLAASPTGLATSYKDLIRESFQDNLTTDDPLPDGSGFTQIEANFSLFWGLSVMLYDSVLVPDDTPFDRFAEGDKSALTSAQVSGLNLFMGKARCIQCHNGPEFTAASIQNGNDGNAFANTGVRPIVEDLGRLPEGKAKFKTATLRNVELTGPYFHTGGYLTLRQVVDFYNRGGDFRNKETNSQVRSLGLTSTEKGQLVAFMLSLTDDRVRFERAPFDHPSIVVPNGPSVPAVGANGSAVAVTPFLFTGDPQFHFKALP